MVISKKFKGMVQIFRPELPFAAGVCVILGEIIALGYFPSFQEMSLGFICAFFLSGSAILINDYFDLEVDRIDVEGDRKRDSKSIAIRVGRNAALRISAALFESVVLLSFAPFVLGWLCVSYLVLISVISISVLFFTGKLLKSETPEEGRSSMRGFISASCLGYLLLSSFDYCLDNEMMEQTGVQEIQNSV